MMGKRSFHSICAAQKPEKRSLLAIRFARLVLPCTRTARPPTMDVPARNTAVHSVSQKPAYAPATTGTGITAKGTEAVPSTRLFPQITGFPLTADASISNEHILCGQSASATIPAPNPQVRSGCGYETPQARQISIHWRISLHWRLP